MDYFILMRRDAHPTDTAVLFAGRHREEPTAPVFTTRNRAQRFAIGWSETDEVRRLNAIDLLDWLLALYRRGVQRIAIDPERQSNQPDSRPTCSLRLLLADVAECLAERLYSGGGASDTDFDRVVTWRCERCGKVRRQFANRPTPGCCDAAMVKWAEGGAAEKLVVRQK